MGFPVKNMEKEVELQRQAIYDRLKELGIHVGDKKKKKTYSANKDRNEISLNEQKAKLLKEQEAGIKKFDKESEGEMLGKLKEVYSK